MTYFGSCPDFEPLKYPSDCFSGFSFAGTVLFLFLTLMKTWFLRDNDIMAVGVMSMTHIPYLDKIVSHSQTADLLKARYGIRVQKSGSVLSNRLCRTAVASSLVFLSHSINCRYIVFVHLTVISASIWKKNLSGKCEISHLPYEITHPEAVCSHSETVSSLSVWTFLCFSGEHGFIDKPQVCISE